MGLVLQIRELQQIRNRLHEEGKKVVFTNGCFDILHRGHIEYLQRARALGDVLVVGVNSDTSVRRIKGPDRPIVNQEDRIYVLSNLSSVDYACLFEEDTPLQLIAALVPDILVKGSDWKIDAIIGKDIVEKNGGRVMTIDYLPNRSTSGIIERIIELYSKHEMK